MRPITSNFHTLVCLIALFEKISVGAAPIPGQVLSHVPSANNLARSHHSNLIDLDTDFLPLQRRRLRQLHRDSSGVEGADFDAYKEKASSLYHDTQKLVDEYLGKQQGLARVGLGEHLIIDWPGGHLGNIPTPVVE